MALKTLTEFSVAGFDANGQNPDVFLGLDDETYNIQLFQKTPSGVEVLNDLLDASASIGGAILDTGLVAGADATKEDALELSAGENIVETAAGAAKSVKFVQDGTKVKIGSRVSIVNKGSGQTLTVYLNNVDGATGTIADNTRQDYLVEAGASEGEYALTPLYNFTIA